MSTHNRYTDAEREHIVALVKSRTTTYREIAKEYGVCRSTITRWVRTADRRAKNRYWTTERKVHPQQKRLALHLVQKLKWTQGQAAKATGITQGTISRWINAA